eukprot:Amastigsp_a844249_36.p4 type:complete len:103 gc:universal Amastigsp_a844249_36:573-265(-)
MRCSTRRVSSRASTKTRARRRSSPPQTGASGCRRCSSSSAPSSLSFWTAPRRPICSRTPSGSARARRGTMRAGSRGVAGIFSTGLQARARPASFWPSAPSCA